MLYLFVSLVCNYVKVMFRSTHHAVTSLYYINESTILFIVIVCNTSYKRDK